MSLTFKDMIISLFAGGLAGIAFLWSGVSTAAGGDRAFGEYLSSECVTCHRAGATDAQIPAIQGMDEDALIEIMNLYRSKEWENPTMQTIAGRLSDEEIAALAAYFSSLPATQ